MIFLNNKDSEVSKILHKSIESHFEKPKMTFRKFLKFIFDCDKPSIKMTSTKVFSIQ